MSQILARIEREMTRTKRSAAQRWSRGILLTVLGILVPFMGMEIVLRVAKYYRPQIALSAQTETTAKCAEALNDRFATNAFEPDPWLLWRQHPGSNLMGIPVNSRGLLGPEPVAKPKPGSVRVLCMGDSTSAVTYRIFPLIAQRLIKDSPVGKMVEFIDAAVAGYSTEQALRLLPRLSDLHPDIIIICYGWNDHFPALNLPDKALGVQSWVAGVLHGLFRSTRVYQYLTASRDAAPLVEEAAKHSYRVGPLQYEDNLRALIAQARAIGAVPVLATQPQDETASAEQTSNSVSLPPGIGAVHKRFNSIVRSVAADTRTPLMDLDEEFDRRSKEYLLESDGMHLTGPGHNLVARLVIGALRNQKVISRDEFDGIVKSARYDSTAPDKPRAAWSLFPARAEVSTTQSAGSVNVIVKNAGNTVWLKEHVVEKYGLKSNVKFGPVEVTGEWKTSGVPTSGTAASSPLSHDLFPGESASASLSFAVPKAPGEYAMEVGLVAAGIGPLKYLGAETTTLTVAVRNP